MGSETIGAEAMNHIKDDIMGWLLESLGGGADLRMPDEQEG